MTDVKLIGPDQKEYMVPDDKVLESINQYGMKPPQNITPTPTDITKTGDEVITVGPDGKQYAIPNDPTKISDSINNYGMKLLSTLEQNGKNRLLMESKLPMVQSTSIDSPVRPKGETAPDLATADGKYKLVSPSGEKVEVPPDQVIQLIANHGYELQDKEMQALTMAHLRNLESHPIGTAASTYARVVSGNTLFKGLRSIAGTPNDEDLQKEILNQPNAPTGNSWRAQFMANQILREKPDYKNAMWIPEVAGEAAALAATEGAGVFSGASKAGTVVKNLVRGGEEVPGAARAATAWALGKAAEGALITSPQAIAQYAIDKDPKAAAETLTLGAGLNIGLGGFGKLLGAAAEKVRPSAVDAALREAGASEDVLSKLGNAEQKETFLKSLQESGLKEGSSANQVENTLNNISKGQKLIPVLEKLEPYVTKEAGLGNSVMTKLAEMTEKNLPNDKAIESIGNELAGSLQKLTDDSGNMSLTNLQKFIEEVDSKIKYNKPEAAVTNAFLKAAKQEGMQQLLEIGDAAASKADAKTVASWSNLKSATQLGEQMHTQLVENVGKTAFSPIFKIIKTLLTHKLSHVVSAGVGGAMGHGAGPVGAIAGASAAAAAHAGIEKGFSMVEHYISNPENSTKLGGWLSNKINSPAAASYLTVDAMHALGERIDRVPGFIVGLGSRAATVPFATKESPIKQILGESANGLSKQQQFDKLSGQLALMASNSDMRSQHLKSITASIAASHPGLAEEIQKDYENKIQYLHQIAPKNPNPPKPFTKDDKWQPSASDLAEFEQHLKIAQNPFVLLDKLKEGKITSKEVATASMLNPQILNHIRDQLTAQAYSGKIDLTYQQKLNASILMGTSMHASLDNIQALQSVYGPSAASTQPVPPGASGGKPGKGGSHLKADKMPATKETMAQRLMK